MVTGWRDLAGDRPIGTGRSLSLFPFQVDRDTTSERWADVQDVLDALSADVGYDSIYGEKFSTDTDVD